MSKEKTIDRNIERLVKVMKKAYLEYEQAIGCVEVAIGDQVEI